MRYCIFLNSIKSYLHKEMIYEFLNETQYIHCMLSIRSVKPETGLWEDAMSISGPYRPFVDTIKTRSSSSSISLSLLLFLSGRSTFLPPRLSDRLTNSGRLTDSTRADKERPCMCAGPRYNFCPYQPAGVQCKPIHARKNTRIW